MITCDAARELLLEAEPAELRGEGDRPLAAHLRGCTACRQRAAHLIRETDLLRSSIDGSRPSRAAANPPRTVARGMASRATPRRWRIVVPLALAAGIAALVLWRGYHLAPPRGAPLQVATATSGPLDVQVPASQSVAVFQTANPNIVVIWSY